MDVHAYFERMHNPSNCNENGMHKSFTIFTVFVITIDQTIELDM